MSASSCRLTLLGCGSSGGVPRLSERAGGDWGDCDPTEPKNRRQRCSALLERFGPEGKTTVLIDTSPDMRAQLLGAGVGRLDAVVYTHSHADHVHGLDDLRMIVYNMGTRVKVWADGDTQNDLISRFGYAFIQPSGSSYPPILDLHTIDGPIRVEGAGGAITLTPFKVNHGAIDALGFRIGDVAYLPDVFEMDSAALSALTGLEVFVVDALRYKPHPTHANLDKALAWIKTLAPERAVITNLHIDMDYATLARDLPAHIRPAFDGMQIDFDLPEAHPDTLSNG
ncbi:Phosphoribosyl 1,2-cyclic phosphodiesterase [Aquimixticola soesokkakensis]|uniref:Phosphoribosyl 1,2-cyclic phosphodiesterase n=1 Tax=Aquimixticola soesokkakensis TaxID=1519096 RepID=A0A1Y5S8H9_9RHOB|nr:MBL fold metallo-hydrolase [Aquimixticola soesokkakensis]SLN34879.1 Phosphoribosyl 1,2-cyclic phosphodiesterase [Aquimixticola soesokkakensis]